MLLYVAAVVLAAVVLRLALFFAEGVASERALDGCAFRPHRGSATSVRWTWSLPGYVCVYSDGRGRVLYEERP